MSEAFVAGLPSGSRQSSAGPSSVRFCKVCTRGGAAGGGNLVDADMRRAAAKAFGSTWMAPPAGLPKRRHCHTVNG